MRNGERVRKFPFVLSAEMTITLTVDLGFVLDLAAGRFEKATSTESKVLLAVLAHLTCILGILCLPALSFFRTNTGFDPLWLN